MIWSNIQSFHIWNHNNIQKNKQQIQWQDYRIGNGKSMANICWSNLKFNQNSGPLNFKCFLAFIMLSLNSVCWLVLRVMFKTPGVLELVTVIVAKPVGGVCVGGVLFTLGLLIGLNREFVFVERIWFASFCFWYLEAVVIGCLASWLGVVSR